MAPDHPDLIPLFLKLANAALFTRPIDRVMAELNQGLNALGFDIARAHLSTPALHTVLASYSLDWHPDRAIHRTEMAHGVAPSAAWRESPFNYMLATRLSHMRQRLDRANAPFAFPVFQEFSDDGMTDWVACSEGFDWFGDQVPGGQFGILVSWTTRREGGFTPAQEQALCQLAKPFAVAVKAAFLDMIARDVLGAYIGHDAATRVLSGAITRGGVTQIPAVVMIADIKGFTRLSLTRPIAQVVGLLNDTFDVIADAIEAEDGHVLKFMGDGVLAIFLLDGHAGADAASHALAAADRIRTSLPSHVGVDIGLSVGEVHYGNVGSVRRLDFTAIGPAVNEAARLEALCSTLGHSILMVGRVAATASDWAGRLRPIGLHVLKGFDDPRMVYALD